MPKRKRNTQEESKVHNELNQDEQKQQKKTVKNRKKITLDYFYDDLLDYALLLGMTVEQYWYGNPKLLLNFEKRHEMECDKERQKAWLIGAYVKSALESTILTAGLADKDAKGKMPKYPDCPMPKNEDGEIEMTEKAKELERERLYRYYQRLAKINNKKGV